MLLDLDAINLELVRGDTFTLSLPLNCGTRESFVQHTLQQNEALYIGIMRPNQSFECADIRIMINSHGETDTFGNPILKLKPSDTEHMVPGKYYITIKFVSNEDVYTLINQKQFFIIGTAPCAR